MTVSNEELKKSLIELGVLDDNGGLKHCYRCECETSEDDDIEWGNDLVDLIAADRAALLERLTKAAVHYTADGLVVDALDPWAVPLTIIEQEEK